jgi:hypothetical protein
VDRGDPIRLALPSPDGKYAGLGVTNGESNVWMVENY